MSMRRVYSILTVMGLLVSMASPIWAAEVEATQPMQCHREHMQTAQSQVHGQHCHEMDESSVPTSDETSLRAVDNSKECPMNCCVQGMAQSFSVLPSTVQLPLLVSSIRTIAHTPGTFAIPGFSSHTDRGPPLQ